MSGENVRAMLAAARKRFEAAVRAYDAAPRDDRAAETAALDAAGTAVLYWEDRAYRAGIPL